MLIAGFGLSLVILGLFFSMLGSAPRSYDSSDPLDGPWPNEANPEAKAAPVEVESPVVSA